jgi:uncharacterized protein YndB with AHSA1/START domain
MADIIHAVPMKASAAQVFRAITAPPGLSGGFAREGRDGRDGRVRPKVDSLAEFRFGDGKLVAKMRVAEMEDGAHVAWTCVEGPPDWVGTEVTFDLAQDGEETMVRFRHRHWREASDFMGLCSAKWAFLLFSLKSLLETPEPDDLYI